jgi:predicted PilT family ATPase
MSKSGNYVIKSNRLAKDMIIGVIHTNAPQDVVERAVNACDYNSPDVVDAIICMLKVRGYNAEYSFEREIHLDDIKSGGD